MIDSMEVVKRLILSAIVGGLIGIEREVNNRPAGLRTHVLVTLGSTLIMLVSIDGLYRVGDGVVSSDPYRLASQVVSGIGFLGAGTIMRTGNSIKGLTTAASLWVSAGIGLAIGTGYYLGGIVTASIVLITLMSLGLFEKKVLRKNFKTVEVIGTNRAGLIGEIGTLFGRKNISIKDILIINDNFEKEDKLMEVHFNVKLPRTFDFNEFYNDIYKIYGVENIRFEGVTLSIIKDNKD